ncbi:MAG TPA: hypothetical protein VFS21_04075 [Roseiflexaceae bacterium]|nr:hypothetical protein [Roseiflexaceae bacterium]
MWPIYQANIRMYRRNLWVLFATAAVWLVPMVLVRRSEQQLTQLLIVYGEVVLPAVLASMSLGLVLNDPYREVLVTAPLQIRHLIISRFVVLLCAGALTLAGVIGAGYALQQYLTVSIDQIFIGSIITIAAFSCLGSGLALGLAGVTGGGICIAALWTCALLFRETVLQAPGLLLFYPFMTLQAPNSPLWPINRGILIAISIIAVFVSVRSTENEERIITSEANHEEI